MYLDIMTKAQELGALIKETEVAKKVAAAAEKYDADKELIGAITEYNEKQQQIADSADDEDARMRYSSELVGLYEKITKDPVYKEYMDARSDFDRFYTVVMNEIKYALSGEEGCTHDCSTCGGCH